MIEIYFKSIKDLTFQKIKEFKVGSWIHIDNATLDDLKKISQITNLEIEDIKDSLDKHEIPRIEQKQDKTIIFVRHPSDEKGMSTTTMAIILTKSYIITISPQENILIDSVINSKIKLATTQKSKLLIFFLLKITQDFTLRIKKANYEISKKEMYKNINNKTIIKITKNEETLNQYLSSLVPMKNLLEAITSGRYIILYEKDHDLLQDLLIAIKQSEDLCRVSVKSIRSLRDAYQIIFTNNVNKTIKFLTAITIIFTIPTILSSIYGMNVTLPLAHFKNAFSMIMGITVFVTIGITYIFYKKKWL